MIVWRPVFFVDAGRAAYICPEKIPPGAHPIYCLFSPPEATSGTGAETWGIWRVELGRIEVWLQFYQLLRKASNTAPAGWRFDIDDWWLDENTLIMRAPDFLILCRRYYATNGEGQIALLNIDAPNKNGKKAWPLSNGKIIKDVTDGSCQSARYTPIGASGTRPQRKGKYI